MDAWIFTEDNPKLQVFIQQCQKECLAEVDKSTVEIWLNEILENNFVSRSAYEFDKAHSSLLQKVHQKFNAKLFKLFKHEYLNGHDDAVAFNNICRRVGYKTVSKDILLEWFKKCYESKDKDEIHPEYRHLITSILEFRTMFKCSFYFDRDCRFSCGCLDTSSRYKFTMRNQNNKLKLVIVDRYHGHQIKLNSALFENKFQTISTGIVHFLQNYGSYWLVLNEKHEDAWANQLFLLSINFKKREFVVVEEESIMSGQVEGVSFDQMDACKFSIKIFEIKNQFNLFMLYGRVTEDMRIQVDRSKILLTKEWNYEKLRGDIFYGICNEVPEALTYCSMNINSREYVKEFELNFNCPKVVDSRFMWKNYAWLGECCYFQAQRNNCYFLNTDTRRCSKLDFLSLGFSYGVKEIDQNDEHLLLISDNAMCVVPLRKPLKLERIAFFNLRRYTMFLGSSVHKQAVQQMPLTSEFQLFYDFK